MFNSQKVFDLNLTLSPFDLSQNKNPCTLRDFSRDFSHDFSREFSSSTQLAKLSQLSTSSGFIQKQNFSECRITVVLSRDVTRDFVLSRWAPPPPIQPSSVSSTRLAVYIKQTQK